MKTVIFTIAGRTASFRRLRILAVRGSFLDTSNFIEFSCIVVAPVYRLPRSRICKACKTPMTMHLFSPWEHIVMGISPRWRCTPRSHGYGVVACTIRHAPRDGMAELRRSTFPSQNDALPPHQTACPPLPIHLASTGAKICKWGGAISAQMVSSTYLQLINFIS